MRLVHVALFLISLATTGAWASGSDPLWHRSARFDYRVAPDGTSVSSESWDVRADTNALAHTIAQQSYSYTADLETVELVTAYTSKRDGRILPVPSGSVLDTAVTTLASAPQFSAQAVRTIVFPQVSTGDTVHYELRRTGKVAMFTGEFLVGVDLGGGSVAERAEITISLPPGRSLRTASGGLEELAPVAGGWERRAPVAGAGGSVVRRWVLAANTTGPVWLQGSTFADYVAVGRAYAGPAWQASRPGAGVHALAEQLAPAGSSDAEAASQFYHYVASEIRYVATFLGKGRVVPRSAETVLAEGWGDCKDHAALLEALLAARGIKADPALISLHGRYDLPDPPGLSVLDHVVTYVPSLDLYLDSTAPYAPFGLLLAGEYDKPVVIADPDRVRLGRTPAMPASGMRLETRTQASIGGDGVVSGDTTTIATGPQSIALRSMAAWYEGRGPAYAASAQLQLLGTPGAGRYAFASPDEDTREYRVAGRFVLDDRLAAGTPFAVPSGLGVFGRPGKVLLSAALTEDGGHACFPGIELESIRLVLPDGAHAVHVPENVDVAARNARYLARYAVDGDILTVRREFRLQTDHERCTPDEFAAMRPALEAAGHDQHGLVTLALDEAEAPKRVAATP